MQEVKVGQRWRAKDGVVLEVENSSTGGLGVRPVERRDVPLIRILPEAFARHHTLVAEADGSRPQPPAPPALKVGDVVRLKCGGPPMVVANGPFSYSEGRTEVRLCWHDADGKLLVENVPADLLVPSAVAMDLMPGQEVDLDRLRDQMEADAARWGSIAKAKP